MNRAIGPVLISCLVLVGCTVKPATDEHPDTAKPNEQSVDTRSTTPAKIPKPQERYVAEVVSVTDNGARLLEYTVEFKITQGPCAGGTVRCLVDGHGDQAKALGRGENWWWHFVYEKSEYKGARSFEITYGPSDPGQSRDSGPMELLSLRAMEMDARQQGAAAEADEAGH
jgi:hypothetical protein